MMRKGKVILVMLFSFPCILFAQEASYLAMEIENLVSAVKTALPGDYIRMPSGKQYILTREEIAIAKGVFDYEDLSDVETETRADGTEIKTISQAHVAYIYPDGQSTHIFKTGVSFTAFMRHITDTYSISYYIDDLGDTKDRAAIPHPKFDVFRAGVQFRTISDGIEELQDIFVTVYNYDGENFMMRYCSKPEMFRGNVSGETHPIEFDIK
jgi:hypothetical protein